MLRICMNVGIVLSVDPALLSCIVPVLLHTLWLCYWAESDGLGFEELLDWRCWNSLGLVLIWPMAE